MNDKDHWENEGGSFPREDDWVPNPESDEFEWPVYEEAKGG